MLLARPIRSLAHVAPSCSQPLSLRRERAFPGSQIGSRRAMSSSLPPAIAPLFEYAADCNVTQGLQLGMEALHGMGLPWASAFVASGLLLRLGTSPFHVYAEKLMAKRLHAQNFFTHGILKKLSELHKVEVAPSEDKTRLELKTNNPKLIAQANKVISDTVPQYLGEHNLHASRIQNLRLCSVPVWIFSSFALRNIISSDFHPSVVGALWVPDLLVPDPYFVLPVLVGLFGFLNIWSRRRLMPVHYQQSTWSKSYEFFLGGFTLFAVTIMVQLPACIPLYWLTASMSGFAQSMLLRHPTIKEFLGIQRLPTDSRQPIRDLFLSRK